MNVSLTKQLEKWVRSQVKSGDFETASEVVRDALRRARSGNERLADLRAEVKLGLDQADAGLGRAWNPAKLKRDVRARVKSASPQATRRRSA